MANYLQWEQTSLSIASKKECLKVRPPIHKYVINGVKDSIEYANVSLVVDPNSSFEYDIALGEELDQFDHFEQPDGDEPS